MGVPPSQVITTEPTSSAFPSARIVGGAEASAEHE
jgi:hypothetical protein